MRILVGLTRTIYIRCIYGIFCREITKCTAVYGGYIRSWATLRIRQSAGPRSVHIRMCVFVCVAGVSVCVCCRCECVCVCLFVCMAKARMCEERHHFLLHRGAGETATHTEREDVDPCVHGKMAQRKWGGCYTY
jgi:hypothetical protein